MPRRETRRWEADPDAYGGRAARRSFEYEVTVPDFISTLDAVLPTTVTARVSEAERAIQSLNQPLLAHQLGALAPRLLRAESVASSWIEGLQISQRRLARAEAGGEEAKDATARAVLGNIVAMEQMVDLAAAGRALGLRDLLKVHKALMELTPNPFGAGELRKKQNWIGDNPYSPEGADHVPPPPEYVPDLVKDLLAFTNREDLPPVFQAAVAHAQFEAIHPFADGNGRTGRALIHFILRRRGLASRFVPPISLVLATHRDDYIRGLGRYLNGGDPGLVDWLDIFGWAVHKAARHSEKLAERVVQLQGAWRQRAGRPRADSSAEAIIEALPARPIITSALAVELTGRTPQAVNAALVELEKAGVLRSISTGPRRRAFEAPELIQLVNAFEHDLAVPEGESKPIRPAPTRRVR
jgi:Fic family protein